MVWRTPRFTRTDTLFPYTTLFRSEPDVSAALSEGFRSEGIGLHCGITYDACREDERGVTVCVEDGRRRHELKAERLLVATGRTPNTEALELPYAGVAQDARGAIIIDDRMRTSKAGVYAAGDVKIGRAHV